MAKGYYHTKESVAEYIKLAKDVDSTSRIKRLKEFLPADVRLLELGTGPGNDWLILSSVFLEAVGSDNSQEFLKYLKANHPKGKFLNLDAITLTTKVQFDGIYSNKVLHHLNDQELEASISRQHAILNEAGIICHSF